MKQSSMTTMKSESAYQTMESLALPQELYWDGKKEPSSPASSQLFSIDESFGNYLKDDNFANEMKLFDDAELEIKPGLNFPDELINSEDLVVEFQDFKAVAEHWNNTKLQPDVSALDYQIGATIPHPNVLIKVQTPFDVLNYGSSSFDNVILTQLTPPHSPPQSQSVSPSNAPQILIPVIQDNIEIKLIHELKENSTAVLPVQIANPVVTNDSAASIVDAVQPVNFSPWNSNHGSGANALNIESEHDVAQFVRDAQIVDDIINMRANELFSANDECDSMSFTCSSSEVSQGESEEWLPDNSSLYSSSISSVSSSPAHNTSEDGTKDSSTNINKKRTRPYGRGIEDRKIRKKEQNKNAATRYRQKKKIEMEIVLNEEQKLIQRNDELRRTLAECKREAKYLKTLIREFYQKKQK